MAIGDQSFSAFFGSSLSLEDQVRFDALLQRLQLGAGAYLLRQGEVARRIYYVRRGVARLFHTDAKGREHTLSFVGAGAWIADYDSYLRQVPSLLAIELLSDAELDSLPWAVYQREYSFIEPILSRILRRAYGDLQQRLILQMSTTAEALYWTFVEECPDLTEVLTAKQIASYLGVSNECVSRIRRRASDAEA